MKTSEKKKFTSFKVTVVELVIAGTIILLPAVSSSYRPLSEWPGLVVPDTRLPVTVLRSILTPLPLRQIYTDDYYIVIGTSSPVTKPVTSYNYTKEPPSRSRHKHHRNKTKKRKNNHRKMKTLKKNFVVKNKIIFNIEDERSLSPLTQTITPKVVETTILAAGRENCDFLGGLGTNHTVIIVCCIFVVFIYESIALYRGGWFSRSTNTTRPLSPPQLLLQKH